MLTNLINSFIPRQAPKAATSQVLGHPSAGIIGWMSADDNSSGEVVTEDTALCYAAFWCGVRVISEIMASLPCIMYRRLSDGNKERAVTDPRFALVHDAPSDELDAYHFFEASTAHQVIWGNSYAKIVRDGFNAPVSIDLRLPDRVEPKRRREDGVLIYESSEPRETIEYPDMLHGVGFSYDGIKGYSVVKKLAQTLGIAVAGEKYTGSSLKNGGVPSGVLDHPMKLQKDARENLRREWDEIHGGAGKSARLAITHGGIKYTPISMSHEAAQLIDMRKFGVVEVARILRLPLYILADLENSGVRANIEQQAIDLIAYSMMPWVKRWEGALRTKLLRREERGTMFFEFLLDSLLRADTKTRYEAYAIGRQWGWESINDILRKENRNTIGPAGDDYLQPLNMVPAGTPPQQGDSVPGTVIEEYHNTLKATINETMDVAKQMRTAIHSGYCDVHQAFAEFGGQLERSLSSERDTFQLIKQDIAELGGKVQVRVPNVDHHDSRVRKASRRLLEESLRVLLRIEAAEAIKAARGQVHKGQNFLARVEESLEKHMARVVESLSVHSQELSSELAEDHIARSKAELVACSDGSADGFEERVKACVQLWIEKRAAQEAEDYNDRIFRVSVAVQQ